MPDYEREKPFKVIVSVATVSDGVLNNTTRTIEGAKTAEEMVAKAFNYYRGIMTVAAKMAEEEGMPLSFEEFKAKVAPQAG